MRKFLIFLTTLAVVCYASILYAKPLNLNQIFEAACMVSTPSGLGSGVCYKQDSSNFYFMTNAHVVGQYKDVKINFWRNGVKSIDVSGNVIWRKWQRDTDIDLAIIQVPKISFGAFPPRVIKIVKEDFKFRPNDYFATAGCPNGSWLLGLEGNIEKVEDHKIYFMPPPANGRSGSGLFAIVTDANGEQHTRLAAIIAWRLDNILGGRSLGGAIPISTYYNLQNNTHQPTTITANYTPVGLSDTHALGSDGKYYPIHKNQEGREYANHPPGVEIICWPKMGRFEIKPPRKSPDPVPIDPQTPFSNQPPSINYGEEKSQQPKIDTSKLEQQIQQLKEQVESLQNKVQTLESTIVDKDKLIVEYKAEINQLSNKIQEFETIRLNLVDKIKELNLAEGPMKEALAEANAKAEQAIQEAQQLDEKSDRLVVQVQNANNLITELKQEKESTEEVKEDALVQRNVSATLLGVGVAGWISWLLWKLARYKLRTAAIGLAGERIGGAVSGLADRVVDHRLGTGTVDRKVDDALTKLHTLREELHAKISGITGLIDGLKDRINDRFDNNNSPSNNTNNNNSNNNNTEDNISTSAGINARIRQFFALKEHDGESVESWAMFGVLYSEAMEKLRRDQFYTQGETKLQGQRITADAIDRWVNSEYIKRFTIGDLRNKPNIYHYAMLGFLYKEAVNKLREGFFTVLGAQTTADTIEAWVQKEFLNRLGVVT